MTAHGFFKGPAKAYNQDGVHVGPGSWLNVIWAVNRIEPKFFSSPVSTNSRRKGEWVESYEHAEVIHLLDEGSVIVQGTDDYGRDLVERGVAAYDKEMSV